MGEWWFVPAAVGAALAFGTSTHLKHRSTGDIPAAHTLEPGAVGRLVRATVVHRLWLAGMCADAAGLSLQIVALHLGPLSAVQPLLVLGLPTALLLQQSSHNGLHVGEIAWGSLLATALAALVVLTGTAGDPLGSADPGPAIAVCGIGLVLTITCLMLGRSREGSRRAAALLGITAGGVYAATAALIKISTNFGIRDPVSLLWHWQFYTALSLGAVGLVLNQLAFRAGPLTASLPATSVADSVISVVIGIWVFDEHARHGIVAGSALGAVLVALALSAIKLSRTVPLAGRIPAHRDRASAASGVR
jgi:hypothetical protein